MVDVEAQTGQEADGRGLALPGGAVDQLRVVGEGPRQDVGSQGGHGGGVGAHAGGDEGVQVLQVRRGARGGEELGDLGVAVEEGELVGGAAAVGRVLPEAVDLGAVGQQQAGALGAAAQGGGGQFLAQQLAGGLQGRAEPGLPRAAPVAAQAELQQQPQMGGVVGEAAAQAAVVEGLGVVGVGPGLQQQPGQRQAPAGGGGWSPSPPPNAPVSAVKGEVRPSHRNPASGSAPCLSSRRAASTHGPGVWRRA